MAERTLKVKMDLDTRSAQQSAANAGKAIAEAMNASAQSSDKLGSNLQKGASALIQASRAFSQIGMQFAQGLARNMWGADSWQMQAFQGVGSVMNSAMAGAQAGQAFGGKAGKIGALVGTALGVGEMINDYVYEDEKKAAEQSARQEALDRFESNSEDAKNLRRFMDELGTSMTSTGEKTALLTARLKEEQEKLDAAKAAAHSSEADAKEFQSAMAEYQKRLQVVGGLENALEGLRGEEGRGAGAGAFDQLSRLGISIFGEGGGASTDRIVQEQQRTTRAVEALTDAQTRALERFIDKEARFS